MTVARIMAALSVDASFSLGDDHFAHKHSVQCGLSLTTISSCKHAHEAPDMHLSSSLSELNKDLLIRASIGSVVFLNYSENVAQICAKKLITDGKPINGETLLHECDLYLQSELNTVDFSGINSSDVETFEMCLASSSSESSYSNLLPYQLPSSQTLTAHSDRHTSLKSAFFNESISNIPCSTLDGASSLPNMKSSSVTCDNKSSLSDITQDSVDGFYPSSVNDISIDGLEGWDGTLSCLPIATITDSHIEQPSGINPASLHQMKSSRMSISLPKNQVKDKKHDNSLSALTSTSWTDCSHFPDALKKTSLPLNCQSSSRDLQENVWDSDNNSISHGMGKDVHSEPENLNNSVLLESLNSHCKIIASAGIREQLVSTCVKLLEQEHAVLQKSRLCSGCLSVPKDVTFLPCGHFTMCRNCAEPVYVCPVCKSNILATVDTYLS